MALTDKLTAIADAIRGKTGGTEPLSLDEMAAAVAALETGGLPAGTVMGEFTPEEDTTGFDTQISHGLGKIPNFIFIWTTATELKPTYIRAVCNALLGEEQDDTAPEPYNYYAPYDYARGITDTATATGMAVANLSIGGSEYLTNRLTFFLPSTGNRYYAGGVTYKWIAIRTEG